jgi:lysophospholipase L1-like esterase
MSVNVTAQKCGYPSQSSHAWTGFLSVMLFVSAMMLNSSAPAEVPDGDITSDSEIGIPDYLHALQYVLGNRELTDDAIQRGDVAPLLNGVPDPDGDITTADTMVLLRMILYGINFSYPTNQFNIGDSIGEGEAADATIGEAQHESVWSTGYAASDVVNALNERFEALAPFEYDANSSSVDIIYNKAVSGAVMADFAVQAQAVVSEATQLPDGKAGMVTVLLGSNDVCAPSMAEMTDTQLFEDQFRAGLDVLANDEATRLSQIHVSSLPAIYWLWTAKYESFWCTVFAWPNVPCENLLDNPDDDCADGASRNDPDMVHAGDGSNCIRRKQFHQIVRDDYNSLLQSVTEEYRESGQLPNIRFTDIYNVKFSSVHVNGGGFLQGDCFHPSREGHALLANESWCRTHWGKASGQCSN